MTPDTETLHAWLDDELPAEQRAEVEAWLRDHPEAAAQVRLWAADAQALRAQLEPVLSEPVPQRLAQLVWNRAPLASRATGWQRWAAAALVFVLGGSVGAALTWRLKPAPVLAAAPATSPSGWVRRAAVAHAVYTPEVRHPVEVKAQEEHLSRWLTRRLTVPVKLFDLRAQGFELVGGRLLPDATGPSAQLMYQAIADPAAASDASAKPVRVTVYLRKPDDDTPASFRYEQQGSLGMFYWVEGKSPVGGPVGYAIVGELPRERLLAMAEAIYRQGLQ
jgi:anti-sigma factor RsiW